MTTRNEILRKIVLLDGVTLKKSGSFGEIVKFELPKEFNMLVACWNKGTGLHPFWLGMPHQLYIEKLEKMLEKESYIKSFTIIPFKHQDYIDVAKVELETIEVTSPLPVGKPNRGRVCPIHEEKFDSPYCGLCAGDIFRVGHVYAIDEYIVVSNGLDDDDDDFTKCIGYVGKIIQKKGGWVRVVFHPYSPKIDGKATGGMWLSEDCVRVIRGDMWNDIMKLSKKEVE